MGADCRTDLYRTGDGLDGILNTVQGIRAEELARGLLFRPGDTTGTLTEDEDTE